MPEVGGDLGTRGKGMVWVGLTIINTGLMWWDRLTKACITLPRSVLLWFLLLGNALCIKYVSLL